MWWHQTVLLVIMLILTVGRLALGQWQISLSILWWWLGGVLGFLFVFSDRLVHSLVTNSQEVLSLRVRELFLSRKLGEGLRALILERGQQNNLMMRSVLFVVIWLILAFWTMVGVTAPLARGFMLGMGVHFIIDLLWDYRIKKGDLSFWFWQIKRSVSLEEQRWFILVVSFLGGLVILGL
jgi:hypothetical protein